MRPPLPNEIDREIAKLEAMKPKVLRLSGFGDNHHDAIDAQVRVLTDRLNYDAVEETSEENDWRENVRDAALEAVEYLDGDHESRPSKEWETLVR